MSFRAALLLSSLLAVPVAANADCAAGPTKASGPFTVKNGQLIGANGQPFVPRGVNDIDINNNVDHLLAGFPGLNFVRVPVYGFPDPAIYQDAVNKLTAAGVAVLFENHSSSDGSDRGGSQGQIFTGALLQKDLDFYRQLGQDYGSNPLVMSASTNEPPEPDGASLSDWQRAEYDAFRQGSQNPFFFEINGWADPTSWGSGYKMSDYTDTVNAGGDIHIYPWVTQNSTDTNANLNLINTIAQNFQSKFQNANGAFALLFGEYGNSDIGQVENVGGDQVIDAVNQSGYGSAAWAFFNGGADNLINGDGSLSAFGQTVARYIAAGGCPAAPATGQPITKHLPQNQMVPIPDVIPPLPDNNIPNNQPQIDVAAPHVPIYPTIANPAGGAVPQIGANATPFPVDTIRYAKTVAPIIAATPITAGPIQDPGLQLVATVAQRGMSMIVSPIGEWMAKMDAVIVTGMDAALVGLSPAIHAPVATLCLMALAFRGVRIMQGDSNAFHGFGFEIVKIIVVVGLSTNLANFNFYVRSLFYTNLPNFLMKAVGGPLVTNGVNGTASTFDNIWALMWVQISAIWQQAGILDVSSRLSAVLCGITMGLALVAMSLVYLLGRMLLGIVVVLGPICIACTLFEATKPIFERWMGKVIALICLQVTSIVLLTMLLAADTEFMTKILQSAATTGGGLFGSSGAPAPTIASDIQNLISMVIWFGMGAFAMYALPSIAYSIGTGVSASMMPVALGLFAAAKMMSAPSMNFGGGGGSGGSAMSLEFNRDQLSSGGGMSALPAPPPPALSHATAPSYGE